MSRFKGIAALVIAACVSARKERTPRAICGASHTSSSAVRMPSRLNGVLNHGMPADGYGLCHGGGSVA
jgi:hypothetical protein